MNILQQQYQETRERLETKVAFLAYQWFRSRFKHPCGLGDFMYLMDEAETSRLLLDACQELHELYETRSTPHGDF